MKRIIVRIIEKDLLLIMTLLLCVMIGGCSSSSKGENGNVQNNSNKNDEKVKPEDKNKKSSKDEKNKKQGKQEKRAINAEDIVSKTKEGFPEDVAYVCNIRLNLTLGVQNYSVISNVDGKIECVEMGELGKCTGKLVFCNSDSAGTYSEKQEMELNIYSENRDDMAYIYSKSNDEWTTTVSEGRTDTSAKILLFLDEYLLKYGELEQKTEIVNGTECYVITCKGKLGEVYDFAGNMDIIMRVLYYMGLNTDDDSFVGEITVFLKAYVSKDEYKLIKYEASVEKINLKQLAEAYNQTKLFSSYDEASFDNYSVSVFFDYDKKTYVSIPVAARKNGTLDETDEVIEVDINDYLGADVKHLTEKEKNMTLSQYFLKEYDIDFSDYQPKDIRNSFKLKFIHTATVNEFYNYFCNYSINRYLSEATKWDELSIEKREALSAVAWIIGCPEAFIAAGADEKEILKNIDNFPEF